MTKSIDSTLLIQNLLKVVNGKKIFPMSPTIKQTQLQVLSKQEMRILKLIMAGKTSDQISIELNISGLTVKTHRRNMMRKLQTNNTAGLISTAFAKGIV